MLSNLAETQSTVNPKFYENLTMLLTLLSQSKKHLKVIFINMAAIGVVYCHSTK